MKFSDIKGLDELIRNNHAYQEQKEDLERDHSGKVALFSNGRLQQLVDDRKAALAQGQTCFGLGHFSVIEIGATPRRTGSGRPYTLAELEQELGRERQLNEA